MFVFWYNLEHKQTRRMKMLERITYFDVIGNPFHRWGSQEFSRELLERAKQDFMDAEGDSTPSAISISRAICDGVGFWCFSFYEDDKMTIWTRSEND
jgi:hypothetical protein